MANVKTMSTIYEEVASERLESNSEFGISIVDSVMGNLTTTTYGLLCFSACKASCASNCGEKCASACGSSCWSLCSGGADDFKENGIKSIEDIIL